MNEEKAGALSVKLKRLEAYGFKAFADKVTLDFQDGITAIVGPNGCGKSNVVDAIRWVFAERMPTLLRIKKTEDVIFCGSERRKSMSYCEVTLYFDNTLPGRIFKTLDFDEVKITRKVYSNGNSEFYVNDTQVLMRDVLSMVRDTGLGREGYSIVGQSKVEEIITAKPESRRAIFEDAAGVLPAKQARTEAKRNLAEYDNNKKQLEALLGEIERNVNSLERKAEAAKKYLAIRDELMKLEANSYVFQKDNHASQVARLQGLIKGFEEEIQQLNVDYEANGKEFESLMQEQALLDEKLGKVQKEQTELAVKQENILGKGSTYNATKEGLLRTKDDYSTRLTELEREQEKAAQDYRDNYSKKKMAEEELEDAQNDYNEAVKRQNELTTEILDREMALESKNSEINKLLESVGDIRANLGKIEAQKQATLDRIGEYNEEIDSLEKDIETNELAKSAVEAKANKLKTQRDRLNTTIAKLNERYEELEKSINAAKDKQDQYNAEYQGLLSKKNLYEQLVNSKEGFAFSVQQMLKAAKTNEFVASKMIGVVADLIDVKPELQVAIETALGNSIQNIVVANEYDASALIDYQNQHNIGRITYSPLTSVKMRSIEPQCLGILREQGCLGVASKLIKYNSIYESVISNLLGSTVICEDKNIAIDLARKYDYQVRIVTLNGEILATSGTMTGGSRANSMGGILSQETILKETNAAIEKLLQEFKDIKTQYKSDSAEFDDLSGQIEEYEAEAEEANSNYIAEDARYQALADIIVGLLQRLDNAKKGKESMQQQYDVYVEALARVSQQNTDVASNKSDIDTAAREGREEFNSMKEEKTKIDATVSTLRVQIQNLRDKIERHQAELERLEALKETIKSNIETCRGVLSNNESKIENVDTKLKSTVMSEEEKKRLAEIESVIIKIDEEKKEIAEKIKAKSEEKSAISQKILTATDKKSKNEKSLVSLDERIAALEARILEDYNLDYESARKFVEEDFDYTAAQDRIKSLKASRAALGEVDTSSIESYKLEKERFDTKHHEYEDLLKAEEDLKKIIDDLSKEILDKFNTEFAKIQKNFQETFRELFAGGSGQMTIMEPEEGQDPLDAGVEIYAQPPGKRVKNMIALSGGEKALTALAILFAILRLRPLPFCVLDEVDSALDEGNVGVYAKYLKKFANETQFVVITHRKPTMEKSDVLFGITQQERGVSKVVRVSLEEAVKHSKAEAERPGED